MNFKNRNKLIVLIGIIAFSNMLYAQFEKKAQVGMKFLSNPISAEAIARGTAGINCTSNSNGIFWNPALTGLIQSDVDVSLNYHQWIADISYSAIAASINAFNFGIVTLSGTIMDYGDIYTTVRSNNAQGYEETGTLSPTAFTLGLGFSQKVSDRFSYGMNVKYVKQDLGSAWVTVSGDSLNDPNFKRELRPYALGTWAVDIGTYYDFKYKGITFAATLSNVSQEEKYENELFPLPFSVNFGATIAPLQFFLNDLQDHNVVLMFESHHPRDFGEKVKFGLEYDYCKTIYVRTGYLSNMDERGFSAGLGFRKTVSDILIRVDYAFQAAGIFGNIHYFTVGFGY